MDAINAIRIDLYTCTCRLNSLVNNAECVQYKKWEKSVALNWACESGGTKESRVSLIIFF